MKKLLSLIAIVGIMASCNNKKDEKTEEKKTDTTTNQSTSTTNDATNNTTTSTAIPTFADPEVQKFANDLTAWVDQAMEIAKTKDYSKWTDVSMKWADFGTRGSNISMKLANNPEEAKKWSDYWAAVGKKWEDVAKAMMPANK